MLIDLLRDCREGIQPVEHRLYSLESVEASLVGEEVSSFPVLRNALDALESAIESYGWTRSESEVPVDGDISLFRWEISVRLVPAEPAEYLP